MGSGGSGDPVRATRRLVGSGEPARTATGSGGSGDGCRMVCMLTLLMELDRWPAWLRLGRGIRSAEAGRGWPSTLVASRPREGPVNFLSCHDVSIVLGDRSAKLEQNIVTRYSDETNGARRRARGGWWDRAELAHQACADGMRPWRAGPSPRERCPGQVPGVATSSSKILARLCSSTRWAGVS
jgi:hypothetical protein